MPRDKTASHDRIVKAAMAEFLEKGYQRASMKSVADTVGMTSAALYRHFSDKQDMFAALVQPAIDAMNIWVEHHMQMSWGALDDPDPSKMWDFNSELNDAQLILDVMYAQPDAFRLLLFRSTGTPFEGFLHRIIEENTDDMMEFVSFCKKRNYPTRDLSRDEMHMLVTAYTMAITEPLAHGYSRDTAEKYLRTIIEFFTPGWRMVTGL